MNLTARPASHTASPPASRLTGIALAIGIHVIAIVALSSAFVAPTPVPKPATPEVTLKDEKQPDPPKPIDHWVPKNVAPTTPQTQPIDPPVWEVAKEPTSTPSRDDPPRGDVGPTGPTTLGPVSLPVPKELPKAGAVCTRMTAPDMPNVNFAGDALFRAVATTRGGHVTNVEIQALSSGIDTRSLRAFKHAIENALGSYECQGDVRFTQEFNFRLE